MPCSRSRPSISCWQPRGTATCSGSRERCHVFSPGGLVEVGRQQPTGVVLQEKIDPHHVTPLQVIQDRLVVHEVKRLVRALPAPDSGQLAHPRHELVGASGRVAEPAGLLADEPGRIDVRAAPKERSKEAHLVRGSDRGRDGSRFVVECDGRCRIRRDDLTAESFEVFGDLLTLSFNRFEASLFLGDLREQARLWALSRWAQSGRGERRGRWVSTGTRDDAGGAIRRR